MKHIVIIMAVFISCSTIISAQTLKTEKVILITLDGLRWQELYSGADSWLVANKDYVRDTAHLKDLYWADSPIERREKLMPFMWSIVAEQGALYGNREFGNEVDLTNKMWFSYPGYNEILTGKADDERINSNAKNNNPNITVLEYLNADPDYKGKVAAFGSWDVFPYIVNEERSGVPVNAGFETCENPTTDLEKHLNLLQAAIPSPWSSVRLDAFTHYYALEHLKEKRPDVLYIAYGETDDFAHDGRYDFYLTSATRNDAFIREIWEWVQNDPEYKDKTSLIISTDHGRGLKTQWTDHGQKAKESYQSWFAVLGPDFKNSGEMQSKGKYYNNQYAATVAYLLGKDYSPAGVGVPLKDIIDLGKQ